MVFTAFNGVTRGGRVAGGLTSTTEHATILAENETLVIVGE
jgi:hypothetical protein